MTSLVVRFLPTTSFSAKRKSLLLLCCRLNMNRLILILLLIQLLRVLVLGARMSAIWISRRFKTTSLRLNSSFQRRPLPHCVKQSSNKQNVPSSNIWKATGRRSHTRKATGRSASRSLPVWLEGDGVISQMEIRSVISPWQEQTKTASKSRWIISWRRRKLTRRVLLVVQVPRLTIITLLSTNTWAQKARRPKSSVIDTSPFSTQDGGLATSGHCRVQHRQHYHTIVLQGQATRPLLSL
mmetsp:Transcript_15696/g.23400  ORF Transcript_15696/g.23400 Transcript_15696/m.23400 type:complete len:239 (-) Transcript_15696:53-769(-)